jgi:hypothetical protein
MSDKDLLEFYRELNNSDGMFEEDSVVRKLSTELYGEGQIVLHVQGLIWTVSQVMSERLCKYIDVAKTLTAQTN